MAGLNTPCIICDVDVQIHVNGRELGAKGTQTLNEVSLKRGDDIHLKTSSTEKNYVHENCYKNYSKGKQPKRTSSDPDCSGVTLRLKTKSKPFDYPTHCLICTKELDFDDVKRHPDRASQISSVEIVSSKEKRSLIQESLMKKCDNSHDNLAVNVKARIHFAGDLRAVEAHYHRTCMTLFLLGKGVPGYENCPECENCVDITCGNSRNLDTINDCAFNKLCYWLQQTEQMQGQFSLQDLRDQLATYLPEGVPPYTEKHLKRRLVKQFGECVCVAQNEGKINILTFRAAADNILHQSYIDADNLGDSEETLKQTKLIGAKIREDILNIEHDNDTYPSPSEFELSELEKSIPDSLHTLVANLFSESRSESANMKKQLLITSLCHILMQATGQQSYISPLMLSVGLFIKQTTRSRVLIDVLSSLGLCISYTQILQFEKSAAVGKRVDSLISGLVEVSKGGGFCQWVADNFDYNEDTKSGHDTTHVMGIIACQTETSCERTPEPVVRQNPSSADIMQDGNFSSIIKCYKRPLKSCMSDVKIGTLSTTDISTRKCQIMDTLWLLSSRLSPSPPTWQGFMSDISKGEYCCTNVVFNPMVPLNPSTDEAVYSTMVYVKQQAMKVGMCCATLTFDQPLYLSACKIKQDNQNEFKNMFLRLGGFHLLMSFLGAGCKLMEDSGIEELWGTVYAKNSLPKMMEGKSYTKTLRACLLTNAALHLLLFEPEVSDAVDTDLSEELAEQSSSGVQNVDVDCRMDTDNEASDCMDMIDNDDDHHQVNMSDRNQNSESNFQTTPMPGSGCEDQYTVNEEPVESDNIWSRLKTFYSSVLAGEICLDEITANKDLIQLHEEVIRKKESHESNRTAKLWLMFMGMVEITMLFIRAERTGCWKLHLLAIERMLPFLAAAGHNNYAKCCRLYLQDCQNLCECLEEPIQNGEFAIRRKKTRFWSGTWSDMTIEQSLMRSGKTVGGLINITHKDSARNIWLLTAHVVAMYTDALRCLTSKFTGSWSEQHKEMHPGNIRKDSEDMETFKQFLLRNNPFRSGQDSELRNIATGVVADERVNVDNALQIGTTIQEKLNEKKFGDVKFKRVEQAKTFAAMRKPLKISGDEVRMSSQELYHRFVSMSYVNGCPPDKSVFSHELATVSPALFKDDGSMRKANKADMAKCILEMDTEITSETVGPAAKVLDGCALLHKLVWAKTGTMEDVCDAYVSSVVSHSSYGLPLWVEFDSYEVATTKDQEQKRRRKEKMFPDVVVEMKTPIPGDKKAFLGNKKNKQGLIKLLSQHLQKAGIHVEHAGEEGDADVCIVKKAMELAKTYENVVVVADDTDILIMLIHHTNYGKHVYMQTRQHTIAIKVAKEVLGREMYMCLPFAHAMSGCDTTSGMYGVGKLKLMKLLQSSQQLRADALVFGDTETPKEVLLKVGENFAKNLYIGGTNAEGLDELRYLNVVSSKYVPFERMPPTSRAMYYHSLRVHHQVSTWRHLQTILQKEEFGYKIEGDAVVPVITDKAAAPADILAEIRCSCKSERCVSCTCAKRGIPCSIHCKCEGQCINSHIEL